MLNISYYILPVPYLKIDFKMTKKKTNDIDFDISVISTGYIYDNAETKQNTNENKKKYQASTL